MGRKLNIEEMQEKIGVDKIKLIDVFIEKDKHGINIKHIKYKCLKEDCGYVGIARWGNLQTGSRCAKCSGRLKLTTSDVIEDFIRIHGNKYIYDKVEYINSKTDVCIICPIHGEFWQNPKHHINGCGCSKCSNKARLNLEDIKKELSITHPKINILSDIYDNNMSVLSYICTECGYKGNTNWSNLRSGKSCPSCVGQVTTEKKLCIGSKTRFG